MFALFGVVLLSALGHLDYSRQLQLNRDYSGGDVKTHFSQSRSQEKMIIFFSK